MKKIYMYMRRGTGLLLLVFLLMGVKSVEAAVQITPPGAWEVTGNTVSGAVGDTVSIDFSMTYVTDSYANTDVYIKTIDEAREKVSFVGTAVPATNASVSAERVSWPGTEFEAGVTKKYKVQARIDRGAVGDEIDGFYIYAYAPKAIFFGVVDDIKIKVISKAPTVTPKPTSTTTASPTKVPSTTTQPLITSTPTSTAPAFASTLIATPVNPVDPDGDGLPNDQETFWGSNPYLFDTDADGMPDGDEVRNGTNPAGDVAKIANVTTLPEQPEVSSQTSFFSRVLTGFRGRVQTLRNWFSELF